MHVVLFSFNRISNNIKSPIIYYIIATNLIQSHERDRDSHRCLLKQLSHLSFVFFNFFIFFVVATSSLLLLPHRRSFLFVAPFLSSPFPFRRFFLLTAPSSFLFPTLFVSFRTCKPCYFIKFDQSVTDEPTDGRADGRTNKRGRI